MIKNHFKIAWRNILRHKGFSFLNIAGLTIGLTSCLIIGLFVRDEIQFDKFIEEGDRIYRVFYQIGGEDGENLVASTPPMFAPTLQAEFPEVEESLRVLNFPGKQHFRVGAVEMYEEGGIFADSNFFELFPLKFSEGSANESLVDPYSIVISQAMAERYFEKENPLGKEILLGEDVFKITGVFRNNQKFHLPLNYVLPLKAAGIAEDRMKNWEWYGFHNYFKLKERADIEVLLEKFQIYTHPFINKAGTTNFLPLFQPLHHIYLHSTEFKHDIARKGNITYVSALTIIALFILVIACFNFVNLATAKSLQRAKEVGVRKTIGANRGQLLGQFISETVFLTLISILISGFLVRLLLPVVNQFTGKQISFDLLVEPLNILILLLIALIVGIMAGFYPALVLSGYRPVKVLKGSYTGDSLPGKIPWLRHSLVVIQFSLSVLLIISALVVHNQVNYLHNKDLGFEKDQILFFPMRGQVKNNYETFKQELLQSGNITAVSIGYGFPGDMFGDGMVTISGKSEPKKAIQLMVDQDYVSTLGLQMASGRNFVHGMKADQNHSYIINETAVKEFGLGTPEQALGKTLYWPTWKNPDSLKQGQIIGVVKDFHYQSLYQRIEPAVLHIYPDAYSKVAVKIKTAKVEEAVAFIKLTYNRFSPDYPLEYNFMDESFGKMYQAEDKLKSLLYIFTGLAIFVGCLGLFGLAAFSAERRKREIGIRKVLGASVENIVVMLSKDFVKLVFIALLIASPIAWYFMNGWLQDFAYRINIGWYVFFIAGISAISIALITVGFHAIKAAVSNPVKNIRTE